MVKVQLHDVEVPLLLGHVLVGPIEKFLRGEERLHSADVVEVLGDVRLDADVADGQPAVEKTRGGDVEERVVRKSRAAVLGVDPAMELDPGVQLIVAKADERRVP